MSFAACWAPFLTTDQNEPSSLWVTIAMVMLLPCVSATLPLLVEALPPLELDVVLLLPDPPQPAANSARATSSPRLPSSRLIVVQPLSREPVWSGTRCSLRHRELVRHRPAAPAR